MQAGKGLQAGGSRAARLSRAAPAFRRPSPREERPGGLWIRNHPCPRLCSFGISESHGRPERRRAADRYARLVAAVPDAKLWDGALRQQIYLGNEAFVEHMQALARPGSSTDTDIPKVQRQRVRPLAQWLASCESREDGLYQAHTAGAISMTQIAKELGLSVSRVSRLIARAEEAKNKA